MKKRSVQSEVILNSYFLFKNMNSKNTKDKKIDIFLQIAHTLMRFKKIYTYTSGPCMFW